MVEKYLNGNILSRNSILSILNSIFDVLKLKDFVPWQINLKKKPHKIDFLFY